MTEKKTDTVRPAHRWLKENERVVKALFTGFRIPVDDDNINVWFAALGDLSKDDLHVAVGRAIREYKPANGFQGAPLPGTVRSYAVTTGALNDAERAEWVWGKVRKAIGSWGDFNSVDFSDRIANAAIREMGGWVKLCSNTTEELVWVAKEFVKVYQLIGRSGQGDGSPLPGIAETSNLANGYRPPQAQPIDCGLIAHPVAASLPYKTAAQRSLENQKSQEIQAKYLGGVPYEPKSAMKAIEGPNEDDHGQE